MLWWFAQTTLIAGALAVVATLGGRQESGSGQGQSMSTPGSSC